MDSNSIRRKFVDFFIEHDHLRLPGSSLVPDDPTLLTTSAGMVQFKPYFLAKKKPPKNRVTTVQKCLRAVDIDEVGRTPRHHTFFEMLGNFSFGDYFKEQVIPWAWELLTARLGIPEERLFITVYKDDEEAAEIWLKKVGVSKSRLYRLGEDDNYWPAGAPSKGPNGPCGPCSEIFYDYGADKGCRKTTCAPDCDCSRFVEIWNLVFMQFERHEGGKLTPLPMKNIDTGSGLERMASVLQGFDNNFDTDLFKPIINAVARFAEPSYDALPIPYRIVADHIRGCSFLIADGVFPSNEGRGHLLRRILRRAANAGRDLGIGKPFLAELVPAVAAVMGDAYPELREKTDFVATIVAKEEQQFEEARKQGRSFLAATFGEKDAAAKPAPRTTGGVAFTAYDTYGLPLDEAKKFVFENFSFTSDDEAEFMAGFNSQMESQRERSRAGSKMDGEVFADDPLQVYRDAAGGAAGGFTYDGLSVDTRVTAIVAEGRVVDSAAESAKADLILELTPFYGEMGGQVGDSGRAKTAGADIEIRDTIKVDGEITVHRCRVKKGTVKTGDAITVEVGPARRDAVMRHHTATHLLHSALRKILGEHVVQSGSYVGPDKLRFDFTHHSQVDADTLRRIETEVNDAIMADLPVHTEETTFDDAKSKGVIALFGEKYGDRVRAVRVGAVSAELCGGTHVARTGEIGFMIITEERAVGSNLRRVEALAGHQALEYVNARRALLAETAGLLNTSAAQTPDAVRALQKNLAELEKLAKSAAGDRVKTESEKILASAANVGGVPVFAHAMSGFNMDEMLSIYDNVKTKHPSHAVVFGSESDGKAQLFVAFSPDVVKRGLEAGAVVKEIAAIVDGGGGGPKDKARAGGKNPAKLPEAVEKGKSIIAAKLGE